MLLGFSFAREPQVLEIEYQRSVANQIADGEMRILAAGDWNDFPDGSEKNRSIFAPPPVCRRGHFELTKTGSDLRLEWTPKECKGVGAVVREVTVK